MHANEMLETKSFRILRERLHEAADEGVNAIVYGPPSSEKSFVLETLCARLNSAGKPALYVYCGPRCTEVHLYRSICQAAQIPVRSSMRWACRFAILKDFQSRSKLPAIVLDEAQHLDLDALEAVRQIHDLTRRPERKGCGFILAGSHSLLRDFLHPARRPRLEQMLSRFPHRIQLDGMTKSEIVTLAARAFGNGKPAKLTEEQQKKLLESCSVQDPYFIGADGKPALRCYFSSRRLLEYVRQQKKNAKPILAEVVA